MLDHASNWVLIHSEILERKKEAKIEAKRWEGVNNRKCVKYSMIHKKYTEISSLIKEGCSPTKIRTHLRGLYSIMYD